MSNSIINSRGRTGGQTERLRNIWAQQLVLVKVMAFEGWGRMPCTCGEVAGWVNRRRWGWNKIISNIVERGWRKLRVVNIKVERDGNHIGPVMGNKLKSKRDQCQRSFQGYSFCYMQGNKDRKKTKSSNKNESPGACTVGFPKAHFCFFVLLPIWRAFVF